MTHVTLLKTGETFEELKETEGCYETWFETVVGQHASSWTVVDVFHGDPLPSVETIDMLLITGSPISVYEYRPWSVKAGLWSVDVIRSGRPVLGICYGHQLVAESLGGKVQPATRGREMGATFIEYAQGDPLFKNLNSPFKVWQTHIDEVAVLPPSTSDLHISPIAFNHHCQYQALAIGSRCRTVQWHPEMNQAIMSFYVDARQDVIDQAWGNGAAKRLKESLPSHVESGSVLINNFFEAFV